MREEIIADSRVPVDRHEAVQHRATANFHARIHKTVRTNVRSLADFGRFSHAGRCMNRCPRKFGSAGYEIQTALSLTLHHSKEMPKLEQQEGQRTQSLKSPG